MNATTLSYLMASERVDYNMVHGTDNLSFLDRIGDDVLLEGKAI